MERQEDQFKVVFRRIANCEAKLGYTVSAIPVEGLTICKYGVTVK